MFNGRDISPLREFVVYGILIILMTGFLTTEIIDHHSERQFYTEYKTTADRHTNALEAILDYWNTTEPDHGINATLRLGDGNEVPLMTCEKVFIRKSK